MTTINDNRHTYFCDICSVSKINLQDKLSNQYFSCDQTSKFKRHIQTNKHKAACIAVEQSPDKVECPCCNRVMTAEAFKIHKQRNRIIFAMNQYLLTDMEEDDRVSIKELRDNKDKDLPDGTNYYAPGRWIKELEEGINSKELSCNNFKVGKNRYSNINDWIHAIARKQRAERNKKERERKRADARTI